MPKRTFGETAWKSPNASKKSTNLENLRGTGRRVFRLKTDQIKQLHEREEGMNRRGNGYLDEATERLREEQEKDNDPQTVYEEKMLESRDDEE